MRSRRQSAPGRSTATALTAIEGDLEQEPVGLAVAAQDVADLGATADLVATEVTADADLSVRETAEITARGSHMRRVRRRKPRAETIVAAPEPVWTRGMIAWRVALATVVLGAFVALLGHGVGSLLLAAETPSLVSVILTAFGLVASSYFAMTLWHAKRYRAVASYPDAMMTKVTVIVPAYN